MPRIDAASAGNRDRQVYLVPLTDSQGNSGYPIETEAPQANWIKVLANRYDVSGRERFAADQESASYDTRWTLPYSARFDPEQVDVPKAFTLVYLNRRHDIVAASMLDRRRGVELLTLAAP